MVTGSRRLEGSPLPLGHLLREGRPGEKRGISADEAHALIASGAGLRDIDDASWDVLNRTPPS